MCAKYRIRSYAKPAAANPGEPWRSAACGKSVYGAGAPSAPSEGFGFRAPPVANLCTARERPRLPCARGAGAPSARLRGCNAAFRTATNPGELRRSAAAANPVLCAEHIAFPLGKVARCGAARTVTDEGRPPAAGVLGTAVISESSSVGLYPAAHRAAYFPLCCAIFFTLSKFILQKLKIFFKNLLTK